ncbi:MAG TPA: adenylate/guanylate cyclase domain-containing protein [Candidatus Limnocylindrales bacterium]|nr:adenylate/guanylate cyclase domain-containing protein [Candidatus Limnocylindrales bacterium]
MPRLQVKTFADADQVRDFPLVRVETVDLDEVHVGHCRFDPGWKWSTSFGPMLGSSSCPIRHLGYTLSGSLHVVMDDGQAMDIGPGTVFDIPPGHDKWVIGDEAWVTVEWGGSGRAMGQAMQETGHRQLATVLFTDIVESTARLREVGDAAWRSELAAHNARLREQLNVFRGREVKTTGDGLLATFDSPTRAVRSAAAMVVASDAMGLVIRVGIHTGEVELVGDDVRGIAVHVAARVLGAAGPREVLVTQTTADLVEGSGIHLENAGEHALKGMTGVRGLLRVTHTG